MTRDFGGVKSFWLLVCALLFALAGCSNEAEQSTINSDASANVNESTQAIVWGGPKNIAMLPIIAQKQGLFQKNGLDASNIYLQTGKITLDAVIRGEIQFGVIVEATAAFAAFQPGLNIEIIAVNQQKFDDAIIARKDRGITKPGDLIGKRLGVTKGTNSQMYAYKLLGKNGIAPSQVEIVNLSPPAIVAALNNGDIDAGSVWQPFRYFLLAQLDENAVHLKNDGVYRGYAIIAVNKDYASRNAEVVRKFLSALIDAENYIKKNKKASIVTLAKEIDLEPNLLDTLWNEYRVEVSLDKELLLAMQEEGKWIIENEPGFAVKALPDYSKIINKSFLNRIEAKRAD